MLKLEGGVKRFLEISGNENVKANRDELFAMLKQAKEKVIAEAKTSTAGASAPSKKRSQRSARDEDGGSFESDEEPGDLDSQAQKVTKFAKSMASEKAEVDALTVSCTAAGAAYVALADGKRMVLDLATREEEAARARLEIQREEDALKLKTQREEDALRIETLCKICEQEAVRLKMQGDTDNQKLAMQREADAMAVAYKEKELATQREADKLKLTAQRETDALEAARLDQKLAYEIKMSDLKDKELAREKERIALESQKAAPSPPPADIDNILITVRDVANKHNMLDKVARDKRESVLKNAGTRIASDYSDEHGHNPHTAKEGKLIVRAYPQDNEETMVRLIQLEVADATAPLGELTIESFRGLVKRFKAKEQTKILHEAESNVIGKMLERGSKLMGIFGGKQTFAEGYRQLLYDAMFSAIRNLDAQNDKSTSRPINEFFSTPATRNNNVNV